MIEIVDTLNIKVLKEIIHPIGMKVISNKNGDIWIHKGDNLYHNEKITVKPPNDNLIALFHIFPQQIGKNKNYSKL